MTMSSANSLSLMTRGRPGQFFDQLYHRLLWEPQPATRLLCLEGMARTYRAYASQVGAVVISDKEFAEIVIISDQEFAEIVVISGKVAGGG